MDNVISLTNILGMGGGVSMTTTRAGPEGENTVFWGMTFISCSTLKNPRHPIMSGRLVNMPGEGMGF
jgi:hypothetical protein